jgi:hypothetical protein
MFELRYRIRSDLGPSNDVLTEFARANGVFNAWPYFRELLQTMLHRMELPSTVLPAFRVVQSADSHNTSEVPSKGRRGSLRKRER